MSKEDSPAARMARAAAAAARFGSIRTEHGPQNAVVGGLDGFRMQALEIRKARLASGLKLAMPVVRIIAELGVGKTVGAERLERRHMPVDPDDTRRPVIIATLDTTGTQISLPEAILKALRRPNASHASKPAIAWERAHVAMRQHDVQLVVFDEMNRAARRPSMGEVIGGDVMDMLTKGEAAVAFLGTMEANKVFNRVPALVDRMKSPVVLRPLEWFDDEDKAIFLAFLNNMDEAMHDAGLIAAPAGLWDHVGSERELSGEQDEGKDTARLLWEICRGRLRPLSLLLEEAVSLLHFEGGDLLMTHDILAQAVENHSIENGLIKYNPFRSENPQ